MRLPNLSVFLCTCALLGIGLMPLHAQAQEPRNLQAEADAEAVKLNWDAPPIGAGTTIDEYRLYRDTVPIPDDDPDETEAELIARIRTPDGNPETSYTDAEVQLGTTYYYRVTAEFREGGGDDDESDFSNEASATLPPAITITSPNPSGPSPQPAGSSIDVEATLASDLGVNAATLHVRRGGAPSFTEIPQSLSGSTIAYEETIPANDVTARGVDFYLTATDANGTTSRMPTTGYVSIPVTASGLSTSLPGGTTQSAFRMIAFPTELEANQFSALLEDDLGPLNPKQWRLFRIGSQGLNGTEGGYDEIQSLSATAQPGEAYWIIARESATLDTGVGTSLRTNQPFTIALEDGWNLISNPFAFDLPLANATVDGAPLNDVLRYTGQFVPLEAGDALAPFEGYLARLPNGGSGTLQLNPDLSETTAAPQRKSAALDWSISIGAQIQQARDMHNTIAVAPDARMDYDRHDRFEPPPIGEYVSLYFPHPDWGPYEGAFHRDVRPPTGAVHSWSFAVRTPIRDAVTLTFDGVHQLPADWTAQLVDQQLGVVRNLRHRTRYRFNALPEDTPASFRLVVGPEASVERELGNAVDRPDRIRLFANYPNPFAPSTTIRYALPEAMPVTLRVYDALGRLVTTLHRAERQPAGVHHVVWNGRTAEGRPAASGTYFYRLDAGGTTQTRQMVLVR